ncbi:MAG: NAD(P)-dependent oxidoreductase [Caulobacteraceae bacterium]|nr:NAD(P)-dependent oxidoreductase [Caulobacteraceae bacterium]
MIAVIGHGEAARAFSTSPGWRGGPFRAFDVRPDRSLCTSLVEAVAGAGIVLSLVTADAALEAAREAAPFLAPGALFLDMNSVAPRTKRAAAAAVEAAGGAYVDVAVMAPVLPARLAVPLLASGPAAARALDALAGLGFGRARDVGADIGRAAGIKLVRSVMVKGIEALTAEMMAAARAAEVEEEVLASLGGDWVRQAPYNLERMAVHGARRAAEMEEAAITLQDLGVEPLMTRGTILRQAMAAAPDLEETP